MAWSIVRGVGALSARSIRDATHPVTPDDAMTSQRLRSQRNQSPKCPKGTEDSFDELAENKMRDAPSLS